MVKAKVKGKGQGKGQAKGKVNKNKMVQTNRQSQNVIVNIQNKLNRRRKSKIIGNPPLGKAVSNTFLQMQPIQQPQQLNFDQLKFIMNEIRHNLPVSSSSSSYVKPVDELEIQNALGLNLNDEKIKLLNEQKLIEMEEQEIAQATVKRGPGRPVKEPPGLPILSAGDRVKLKTLKGKIEKGEFIEPAYNELMPYLSSKLRNKGETNKGKVQRDAYKLRQPKIVTGRTMGPSS